MSCWNKIEHIDGGCKLCGKRETKEICEDCLYWGKLNLDIKNHALFYYNTFAKNIIKEIKFSGNLRVIEGFKTKIRNELLKNYHPSEYKIIPVPLNEDKWAIRGFNQALKIAQLLPYTIIDCLVKNENITQSKRTKKERFNAINDFSFINPQILLKDEKIIIVDDIYTTGSTIHQITQLLKEKEVVNIVSFTLFRS